MARGFNYAPGASAEIEEARDPRLHRTQVTVLATSRNVLVREAIAGRQDLPLGLLVTLAHDRSTEVRAAIAANPTATAPIMEHLAGDKHTAVLEALLANPHLSSHLVEKLAFHKRAEVRAVAAARLSEPEPAQQPGPPRTLVSQAPELQERAVVGDDALIVDIATGERIAPLPSRPTRTAPVRGFRAPSE